jgi:hypothetical protein
MIFERLHHGLALVLNPHFEAKVMNAVTHNYKILL